MKRWLLVVVCSVVLFGFGCNSEKKPAGDESGAPAKNTEGAADNGGGMDKPADDGGGAH